MPSGYDALTDKEKATLRLILRGHDAKSSARELGISVHTVNERLRDARRKLSASSSREAARRLFAAEGGAPELLGDERLGDAATQGLGDQRPIGAKRAWLIGGITMSALAILLVLSSPLVDQGDHARSSQVVASDAEVESAARDWLALVDNSNWQASFDAAGASFREVNTVEGWSKASSRVRTPLGTVKSRELIEVKYVNAPPSGYRSVAFFTIFSDGGQMIELVTLEREGAGWRVVGYIIE